MSTVTTDDITRSTRAAYGAAPEERNREVADALVRHLHAFVTEVRPTQAEWMRGIEFLTSVGHTCQGARQEFILLSDVLGVSMQVETINQADDPAATEGTVLGPFYVDNPPVMEHGADIAGGGPGTPLWVDIAVTDTEGKAIEGAQVDVWHSDGEGLYDVQRDMAEGETAFRARFASGADGHVRFWTSTPIAYKVPDDGPVGELLRGTGRHAWRPAHIHFMIEAPGYRRLVTHLFVEGSAYLDSDAVFGVKPSLIVPMPEHREAAPDGRDTETWRSLDYNFSLQPE